MGDVYRESRYREYDDPPSDDERYKRTTVRRYKVKPGREDQYETVEVDEDYRSRYSNHPRGHDDHHDYDRRSERPRSAFEPPDDRSRGGYYERDLRDSDRDRIAVFEAKESDHEDRRSRHGRHEDDVMVERRVEDRFEDPRGYDVDHYRKETEFYSRASPPPSPVVIRERPREPQKIIVQEAPQPPPIVLPRHDPGVMVLRGKEEGRELARRERGRAEDEFYYRHERHDVGPYRGDIERERERDREYAMARYDRYRRDQGYSSDDEDYSVRRRVVRRERSESPHHKRQLAAGALAGAGITALMNSRRDDHGDLPENRGRKVVAGGALGALGTEALRRAHSAYEDRYGDGRESPDHHSHLKKGLGIAAVALAAAGAAKYYQSNKIEKEEAHRGRSRGRSRGRGRSYTSDQYSASRSRSRTKSRRRSLSTVAKAALGTAATAGLVHHYRKKSRSRHGSRSRSKSKIRRAAEIGGAAAAAGVAAKVWKNHKEKKEGEKSRERSRGRSFSDDESNYHRRRSMDSISRSPSRSRSRSQARSLRRQDHGTDPELGLVEYGRDPLSPDRSNRGYESEAEERRRRRRRRDRSASGNESDDERPRSKSRLRNMAAAGAAAMGIKEFKDRKDREKRERKSREGQSRDRGPGRSDERSHERSRPRDNYDPDGYFDDRPGRSGSPPVTSGGAYYPPYPTTPGAPPAGAPPTGPGPGGYTQFPNQSAEYQPYVPQDYTGYPPPPAPGPPPAAGYPAPPPGPPAGGPPPGPPHEGGYIPPEHVSDDTQRHRRVNAEDGVREPPSNRRSASKSVSFIPLSPKSSRVIQEHRGNHAANADAGDTSDKDRPVDDGGRRGDGDHTGSRQRGSSDPYADRPMVRRRPRTDSDEDVEILPDRFDSQGRALDPRSASHGPHSGWTTRSGEFERRPRRPGGWDISGAWQVGGTDRDEVERMARGVTSVLEGQGGWVGVLGGVLKSGLLGGPEGWKGPQEDNVGRGRNRRR